MGQLSSVDLGGNVVDVYESKPDGDIKGGLILIHEVWGLADHIKNVADRLAKEGYLVWAPDLLSKDVDLASVSPLQIDLFNPEKKNEVQPKLRKAMTPLQNPEFGKKTLTAIKSLFNKLYDDPRTKQNIGVIGFCFGGTYSFSLAVHEPRLKLALPFYGHANFNAEELKGIKCPIRAFYGQNDEGLMASLDELKQNMKEAGVDFEATVYPDCGHAFFNDTNPYSYNETASADSWNKVKQLLIKYLS